MKYKLTVGKDRYETLQKKMGENMVFVSEEIEESGTHWVTFDITINSQFDLLDVFHAGITHGAREMSNAFTR